MRSCSRPQATDLRGGDRRAQTGQEFEAIEGEICEEPAEGPPCALDGRILKDQGEGG